jgi:hypothetical protein
MTLLDNAVLAAAFLHHALVQLLHVCLFAFERLGRDKLHEVTCQLQEPLKVVVLPLVQADDKLSEVDAEVQGTNELLKSLLRRILLHVHFQVNWLQQVVVAILGNSVLRKLKGAALLLHSLRQRLELCELHVWLHFVD